MLSSPILLKLYNSKHTKEHLSTLQNSLNTYLCGYGFITLYI